jgi:hypothetical protein
MIRWGKKRKSPAQQKQRRIIILRDTLTLVRVANEVESEEARTSSLKSTTSRDLARSRLVRNAQRILTEQILRGFESGLSLEDITSEVIGPVVDESVIGDVARFAIDEALRGAGRKHLRR